LINYVKNCVWCFMTNNLYSSLFLTRQI
jgi:hypothetical protein